MDPVTVGACWHVRVALSNQGGPVDALFVKLNDLGVTAFARTRDAGAGLVWRADIMSAVTVRAHGCVIVPGSQGSSVNTVQGGFVFFEVASLAGGVLLKRVITASLSGVLGVWISGDVYVALHTGVAQATVGRGLVRHPVHCDEQLLSGGQG
jgi:hypothetical protein